MYAVIRSGGKQYRVESGKPVRVESLAADVGSAVAFEEVLLVGGGDAVKVGAPLVAGAKVKGTVVAHGRGAQSLTQLAAGWQLGSKTFLTLNAGFCPENLGQFSYNNLGASLEFRFSREWTLQTSVEPSLQTCRTDFGFQTPVPYQIGSDILWEREF